MRHAAGITIGDKGLGGFFAPSWISMDKLDSKAQITLAATGNCGLNILR